jgi:isochorismate hydrolase
MQGEIMVRGIDKRQKPALLISEMQRAMADRSVQDRVLSQQVEERGIIAKIAALANVFREAGAPVVHCTLVPDGDYRSFPANCVLTANVRKRNMLRRGEPGAEIVAGLAPHPGDIVSERAAGLTGFHATELERVLRAQGVSTVVLAGVSTNIAFPGGDYQGCLIMSVWIVEDGLIKLWRDLYDLPSTMKQIGTDLVGFSKAMGYAWARE